MYIYIKKIAIIPQKSCNFCNLPSNPMIFIDLWVTKRLQKKSKIVTCFLSV